LQEIDGIDQERLLIERVRISSVTVLIGWRFQEAHGWEVRLGSRRIEIFNVILVVVPDQPCRSSSARNRGSRDRS
jgi:hypothetical protein